MRGPQVSNLIWVANLLLLAGGGYMGYSLWQQIEQERGAIHEKVGRPTIKLERADWGVSARAGVPPYVSYYDGLTMSPWARPRQVVDRPKDPDLPPPPPPTDEALRKELEEWVNKQFKLNWVWGAASAAVRSNEIDRNIPLYPGMNFKTEFAHAEDQRYRQLSKYDITVVAIRLSPEGVEHDHVLLRAPSQRAGFTDKYFEVKLMMAAEAVKNISINNLPGSGRQPSNSRPPRNPPRPPPSDPNPPVDVPDTRPTESAYDEATGTWVMGTDDYMYLDVDEMARFARVHHDREGNAIGIRITDNVPEDSLIRRRGGQAGDVIKAINGVSVRSMADVRRVVQTQYNSGVDTFVVDFERNGVADRKTYRVPRS